MKIEIAGTLLSSALLGAPAVAADIHVPADQPTIQEGIDAAVDGDHVLVAEGRYLESIDFKGKSIQVLSTGNPHRTIIRGAGHSVVLFAAGESNATVFSGFRIEGGQNADVGGGILVGGRAAPEIRGNIVQDNHANGGGGIAVVAAASPWIHDNVIEHNNGTGLRRGIGGGILVSSSGFVVIENNRIHANTAATGGGVAVRESSGITIVARNQIRRNRADVGGGVFAQVEEIRIVDNLIAYNGANTGAGVRVVTSGARAHPVIANNTIAYNEHGHGAGLSSNTVSGGSIKIVNNIIIQERRKALICSRGEDSPIILGDNLIQSHRRPIKGKCNVVGSVLMVDPQFVGGSREMEAFRLSATSPAIDAGDSTTARKFNNRDLGGGQRIVGESVDLGALEFVPNQAP